jgi:hypothetical protein
VKGSPVAADELKRIEAHDLRLMATHEAGHAVLCKWADFGAEPYVYPNPYYFGSGEFVNPDEHLPERQDGMAQWLWLGACRAAWFRMPPEVCRWATLAGWVAEQIEIHGIDRVKGWISNPYPLAMHLRGHIEAGLVSETDLDFIDRWTQKDLVKVLRVLRRNWPALLEWADEVMANPRKNRQGILSSTKQP